MRLFGFAIFLLPIPFCLLAVVVKSGNLAFKAGKGRQYAFVLLSAAIAMTSIPWSDPWWFSEFDVVICSVFFAVGWLLVCSAMIRGHWATTILAGFVAVPYVFTMMVLLLGLDWSDSYRYWFGQ